MYEIDLKDCFSKVRAGDKEAFAHIYNELKQPVFTIAYRIVQSHEVAEDITHDVFVKLFISPPDSSVKNPRAWIFQMARNLSIDVLRKKQCSDIDKVSATTPDEYSKLVTRLDIETAIAKLPCIEREILSLHLTAGLRFVDVAKIVNMSVPATYRKYKKAIKSLQNALNGGAL